MHNEGMSTHQQPTVSTELDSHIARLRDAQRAYLTAHEAMHAARVARDDAVRRALADKRPYREIMEVTGLSRARLDQIKRGTR